MMLRGKKNTVNNAAIGNTTWPTPGIWHDTRARGARLGFGINTIESHTCVLLLEFTGARGPAQQQQARARGQKGPNGRKAARAKRGAGNSSSSSATLIAAPNDLTKMQKGRD